MSTLWDKDQGFKVAEHLSRCLHLTGYLTPSLSGLQHMLINVVYIMYAFNHISNVDFYDEPNEQYVPYRPWKCHNKTDPSKLPPTYADLIYSDDIPEQPHHRLCSMWSAGNSNYKY